MSGNKGVKELKELRRMSSCFKIRPKGYCLNSSATIGSDNSFYALVTTIYKWLDAAIKITS